MTPMLGKSWCRLTSVASFAEAVGASLVSTNSSAATVTIRSDDRVIAGPSTGSSLRGGGVEAAVTAPGTGSPTGAAGTVVVIGRHSASPTRTNGNREALNYSGLAGSLTRVHAIVDREVAAYHVSPSCRSILRQLVGFIINIGGVLSVIDPDGASVAVACPVRLEERVWPVTPLAKTCHAR
jgi:hypothetical protein